MQLTNTADLTPGSTYPLQLRQSTSALEYLVETLHLDPSNVKGHHPEAKHR